MSFYKKNKLNENFLTTELQAVKLSKVKIFLGEKKVFRREKANIICIKQIIWL